MEGLYLKKNTFQYKTLHMGSTYRQVLSFLKKDKQNKQKLTSTDVFILFSKQLVHSIYKKKKKK